MFNAGLAARFALLRVAHLAVERNRLVCKQPSACKLDVPGHFTSVDSTSPRLRASCIRGNALVPASLASGASVTDRTMATSREVLWEVSINRNFVEPKSAQALHVFQGIATCAPSVYRSNVRADSLEFGVEPVGNGINNLQLLLYIDIDLGDEGLHPWLSLQGCGALNVPLRHNVWNARSWW